MNDSQYKAWIQKEYGFDDRIAQGYADGRRDSIARHNQHEWNELRRGLLMLAIGLAAVAAIFFVLGWLP